MPNLTVNGVSFNYPSTGSSNWGTDATAWASAVTSGMLQKAGGSFSLTSDVNFGASFGVLSKYFTSSATSPAGSGALRLANADSIKWRNNANSADVALAKNASDELTYAGTAFVSSTGIILPGGFPALTGDVTTTAGSVATSLVATTNATLATLSALTSIGTISTGVWAGTTIAVNHGGTGVTTSTGTGSVVLSISPTFTGTLSGAAASFSGNFLASGRASIGSGAVAANWGLIVTPAGLTGSTQVGLGDNGTYSTSGSQVLSINSAPTIVTNTVAILSHFYAAPATISSGALTREIGVEVQPGTSATHSAYFSDGHAFTGNWFINQASLAPSVFGGLISASNLSGTNTGDVTIGTANGLSLSSQALSLAAATTSTTGALTSTDWNTFNGKQAALTFTNLADAGTDGITVTNGTGAVIGASPVTLSQHVSDTTHNGYLSSTDWNTFNGKQASGNYVTALTGDVTGSGPGSTATTVAKIQTTVVSGTTGSGNVVFSTSATLVTPALGTPSALVGTNITGTAASLTAGHVTTNANLTGDVTSVGNAATLAATTNATLTTISTLVSIGTITTGVWNAGALTVTPPAGTVGLTINTAGTTTAINSIVINALANITGNVIQFQNAGAPSALIGTGGGNVVTGTTDADIVLRCQAGAIYLASNGNNKTVTIDTNQNVITTGGFCTQGYATSTATSGTINCVANKPGLSITGAGGTTLTIQLPATPIDGQKYWVASAGAFTTVTWQDNGGTSGNVVGGQTLLGGTNRGQIFVYIAGQSKWYAIA